MDWFEGRPRNVANRYLNDQPATVAPAINGITTGWNTTALGLVIVGMAGDRQQINFDADNGLVVTDVGANTTKVTLFDPASKVYFGDGTRTNNGGDGTTTVGPNAVTSGESSSAFGLRAAAYNQDALSLGRDANSYGNSSIAIGTNTRAYAGAAVALGDNTTANSNWNSCLGPNTYIGEGSDESTAVGHGSYIFDSASTSVAIGASCVIQNNSGNSFCGGAGSIVFAFSPQSVVLGWQATATQSADSSIAIGNQASAQAPNTIAQGSATVAQAMDSIVIGNSSRAYGQAASNFGAYTSNNSDYTTLIGAYSTIQSNSAYCTALGFDNVILNDGSTNGAIALVGLGNVSNDNCNTSSAFGIGNQFQTGIISCHLIGDSNRIVDNVRNSFVVGTNSVCGSSNCLVFGENISTGLSCDETINVGGIVADSCPQGIAIGFASWLAKGANNMAMGFNAYTSGTASISIGFNSYTTSDSCVAMGNGAMSQADESVAIGKNANADSTGAGSTVVGTRAYCSVGGGVALGQNAHVTGDKTNIAIGSDSVCDGSSSITAGANSYSDGGNCCTYGQASLSHGPDNMTIGNNNATTGKYCTTIAMSVENPEDSTMIIGRDILVRDDAGNVGPGGNIWIGDHLRTMTANTVVHTGHNLSIGVSHSNSALYGHGLSLGDNTGGSSVFGNAHRLELNAGACSVLGYGCAATAAESIMIGQGCTSDIYQGIAIGSGARAKPYSGLNNDCPLAMHVDANCVKALPIIGTIISGLRITINGTRYIIPLYTNN